MMVYYKKQMREWSDETGKKEKKNVEIQAIFHFMRFVGCFVQSYLLWKPGDSDDVRIEKRNSKQLERIRQAG